MELHILFPVSAKDRRIIVSLIEQNIIFISFQISPGSAVHYAHHLDRIRDTKSGDSPQRLHRKVTNTLLEITFCRRKGLREASAYALNC